MHDVIRKGLFYIMINDVKTKRIYRTLVDALLTLEILKEIGIKNVCVMDYDTNEYVTS